MSAQPIEAPKARLSWPPILAIAKKIVEGYSVGTTLRHLYYRLVARGLIPPGRSSYSSLSNRTSKARLDDEFPDLVDLGREIHRPLSFDDHEDAIDWLPQVFRLDRTEGQPVSIYLGVEKNGSVELLTDWFDDLGLPVLPLGGFASTSLVKVVAKDIRHQARPAMLVYAGDFDSSGEDICRDFLARLDYVGVAFGKVVKVALSPEQVEQYDLPVAMGKATDTRAAGFLRKHGRLVQVEMEALDPDVLRNLFSEAIAQVHDTSAFEAALAREAEEREALKRRLRKRGRP